MCALLRASLDAGAAGFSSSWARTHNDADGNMVPSRYAEPDELIALCRVLADYPGTSIEFNPCNSSTPFEKWAVDLVTAMTAAAQRPLNWNALFPKADNAEFCRGKLALADHAAANGGRVVALTVPMNIGARLTFRSGFVFDAIPGWEPIMLAPYTERLAQFRDPAVRARLAELAEGPHPMKLATAWGEQVIFDTVAPENEQYRGAKVADIAAAQGRTPWEALCDIVIADELNTSFGTLAVDESDDDWKTRLEMWRDPRVVVGASDAGAHLDLLGSFNYTTMLLGRAVREHQLLPLEEAVHLLTARPAELYGVRDRGRLAEGTHADIVVLDEHRVGSAELEMRFDLPGGAGRLYADATGIDHVLVNGTPIVGDGRLLDAQPGTLLRAGRDTDTPAMN
jgi:N-acyl-D-aspartate/D-glutamate deacylase